MVAATYPRPLSITKSYTVAVTAVPAAVDLGTNTAYLMNSGTGKIYVAPGYRNAAATDWLLAAGEKMAFPITGKINVVSDATATLNIITVDE
jgi:hypothetical protein